jgi:hypothetical protein
MDSRKYQSCIQNAPGDTNQASQRLPIEDERSTARLGYNLLKKNDTKGLALLNI